MELPMIRRSLVLSSIASLSLVTLAALFGAGCATEAGPSTDSEEQIGDTQDDLTAAASQLVGSYYTHVPVNGGFARLELKANGKYTAELDPAGKIACITSPCLLPEGGTWTASAKAGGGYRLRVRPAGSAARSYDAVKAGGAAPTLTLTASGVSQKLVKLGAHQCFDDTECSASEECAPRYCLMYCAVTDPLCCGPSTCTPKAAPPPPAKFCGGFAGLPCGADEICVDDPTDGCDPSKGGRDCGGTCQPKPPPPAAKFCGGFAGLPCGADEICVDDPTDGCDPSKGGRDCGGTCQPKPPAPPPPAACFGAWLDQFGSCRGPADGSLPASCCADLSTACGPSRCGVGKVCCNPLGGICTNPGEFCTQ
jgi:hypothetical protein